ncbi:MAG: Ig-like domain-containing protein [Gemmatimonadaceae bacterium]
MKRQALQPPKPGLLSGAHKLVLGTITTAAALMTLMLNAKALGVSSWLGILEPNIADHAARRIVLTPRSDTLRAIGDTAAVVATVTDARGATLAGATLRWRTSDSTVASVDSGGNIVARAPGRATVEVRVREVTAASTILVRPVPAALMVAGDSMVSLSSGDSARVAVVAVDARGHRVRGATPHWSTTDSSVATVDSLGVLRARRAGQTAVVATLGAITSSLTAFVVLTPASALAEQGMGQRALVGRPLPAPLVLLVRTRSGEPVPGVEVTFVSEDGDAAFSPSSAISDEQGRVRAQWTLGRRAGIQRATARVAGLDSAVALSAAADPIARDIRIELMATELRGTVGEATAMPVLVQLRDSAGVALEGVSVSWAALDGGQVEGMRATDVGGNLEAQWVLGPKAGTQRLRLQVGDPRHVPAVTLRASATAAAPYRVSLTSARVPNRSARQIAAKVVDSLGNAVPDVALTLEATSGTLDVSALRSDSLGRARVLWTPSPTPVAKTANKRAPAKSPTPAVRVRLDGTTLSASVTP